MKKWVFLMIVFLITIAIVVINVDLSSQKIEYLTDEQDMHEATGLSLEISKDMVHQGNLLLVNKEYPIQEESIKPDIITLFEHEELIDGYGLLDQNIRLSEEIVQKFSNMIHAAETDGVNRFLISSGYRDFKEQSRLYEEMGEDYALPAGYSEHNLGLSLDVGSSEAKMENAAEGKWIKEHSWKYGFILRYPEDKTDITGIQYEPWHIRYVGLPHSIIMHDKNLVLEEYIAYLKAEGHVSFRFNEITYTVTYYPASQNRNINIPPQHDYEVSGDNIEGVIVTVFSS